MKEKSYVKGCRYYFRIIMDINKLLIEEFQWTSSQILAVTKYFDADKTQQYIQKFQSYRECIVWFWENRISQIIEKKLPRDDVHFIWNLQSKDIKNIIEYCWHIHSVWNKKHLLKIAKQTNTQKKKVKIFLQVQLDQEKNIWFCESEIAEILAAKLKNEYIEIIGISGMWRAEFTKAQKIDEFQYLRDIRTRCMPEWKISAGTSRDYDIASEMNIEIIRIWKKLFL